MDEQVKAARQQEDLADLGNLIETGDEVVDRAALVAGKFHVDKGLHAESKHSEIDFGLKSTSA